MYVACNPHVLFLDTLLSSETSSFSIILSLYLHVCTLMHSNYLLHLFTLWNARASRQLSVITCSKLIESKLLLMITTCFVIIDRHDYHHLDLNNTITATILPIMFSNFTDINRPISLTDTAFFWHINSSLLRYEDMWSWK